MEMQNDKKQSEQHSEENCVHQNGDDAGLHIQEVDGFVLPRKLKQQARAEKPEESKGHKGRRPVVHFSQNQEDNAIISQKKLCSLHICHLMLLYKKRFKKVEGMSGI